MPHHHPHLFFTWDLSPCHSIMKSYSQALPTTVAHHSHSWCHVHCTVSTYPIRNSSASSFLTLAKRHNNVSPLPSNTLSFVTTFLTFLATSSLLCHHILSILSLHPLSFFITFVLLCHSHPLSFFITFVLLCHSHPLSFVTTSSLVTTLFLSPHSLFFVTTFPLLCHPRPFFFVTASPLLCNHPLFCHHIPSPLSPT